jgi:radical SAM protein with 4Fe4S-binding SPASM domain
MRSKAPLRLITKIFFRTPNLIPVVASGLFHKHIRSDADYSRGDGIASGPPSMITLRVTNACNHRCSVCGQYGNRGYHRADVEEKRQRVLPIEVYKRFLDEVSEHKPAINITGGEPFLYPDVMELGNYAKHKGLTVLITTNGVKLRECAEEIVHNNWDMVLVSLDGPEKVHDACRNVQGAFKAAIEGLTQLQKSKKQVRASRPYVNTSTTLSLANVEHLQETFEIGKELAPDLMVLFLSWFTSESLGCRQTEIMKQELGIEPQTWKSYVRSFTATQAEQFKNALLQLKKRKWPFDYFIVPDVGDENYAKYYLEHGNCFGYSKCVAPFVMADVMPNGDVVTCRDFVDVTVGNIQDNSLLEIWNGKPYVQYRKMMIRHQGMLPQCSRCCGLMGF